MTIEEFCREQHIGKATIYARLKDLSITPDSMRTADGQLTDEALSILADIAARSKARTRTRASDAVQNVSMDCMNQNAQNVQNAPETPTSASRTFVNADAEQIERSERSRLIAENAQLRNDLNAALARLDEAQAQIADLLRQAASNAEAHAQAMQTMAERAQQLQAQQLLATTTAESRRGIAAWIKGLFGKA